MRTRNPLIATIATPAVLATGCTAGGSSPGTAVSVGGDSVSLSRVDRLAADYCEGSRDNLKAQNQVYPMTLLRWEAVNAVIDRMVGDQVAEEYDVRPGTDYSRKIDSLRSQTETLDDEIRDSVIEVAGAQAYVQDLTLQAARKILDEQGVSDPSDDQLVATASDLRERWTKEHEVRIDPRFGLDYRNGYIVPGRDEGSLSVEVGRSKERTDALFSMIEAKTQQELVEAQKQVNAFARDLPADQRCG